MDRWTQEKLEKMDNLQFAACILKERKNGLNPYSPLSTKLNETIRELLNIDAEKKRFLNSICIGSAQEVQRGGESD